jgi:hypothetical protein
MDRGTFSRQSLNGRTQGTSVVRPERRWSSAKVIEALADVMVLKGVPEHISFLAFARRVRFKSTDRFHKHD